MKSSAQMPPQRHVCAECGWEDGMGEHDEAHQWWLDTKDWTRKDWDQFCEDAIAYSESMKGEG